MLTKREMLDNDNATKNESKCVILYLLIQKVNIYTDDYYGSWFFMLNWQMVLYFFLCFYILNYTFLFMSTSATKLTFSCCVSLNDKHLYLKLDSMLSWNRFASVLPALHCQSWLSLCLSLGMIETYHSFPHYS